jgi:hypothetical protein
MLGQEVDQAFRSVYGCTKADHVRLTDGTMDGILDIILISKTKKKKLKNFEAG